MTDELKSAVELALEKLDREMGGQLPRLNDEQKERIGALRNRYQAKIAELEIGSQATLRQARESGDGAAIRQTETRLASERQRLERLRDREIEKIRNEP